MKFSIRDLMWLTVVVGLAVGWWVDHYRSSNISYRQLQMKNFKLEDHARQMESLLNQYGWEMKQKEFKGGWRTDFRRPNDDSPNSSAPAPKPPKP